MAKKTNPIRETDEEARRLARGLVRAARFGALAVIEPETGAPFVSRVSVATAIDGAPLILASTLSGHTRGIAVDPRCALLVGEPGRGDPLAHPRMTLSCLARRLERGTAEQVEAERRYLNRHPKARLYAGFGDFSFFRLEPEKASLNGGFGKAYALGPGDLMTLGPATDTLAAMEQSAIDHMNADHADALLLCARHYGKARDAKWKMTGIDADGFDLAAASASLRIPFPERLGEAGALRKVLVEMTARARAGS